MIDFSLNTEQINMIKEINSLAPFLEKRALEIDQQRDEAFNYSLVSELAQHNLLHPLVPSKYGGRGFDYFTMALLMEELGAICPGLATVMIFNAHFTSVIKMVGNDQQKTQYLPYLTDKKPHLLATALSELGAGSDVAAMTTHAEMKDGYYIINGTKDNVISGAIADYIICFATLDPFRGRSQMVAFVVPGNADGLQIGKFRKKMGIHYAHTWQLIFNEVKVPVSNRIGSEGDGYMIVTQSIDRDKALTGAIGVGIARSAFEKALAFAKERKQFGRTVFENQSIAFEFAKMAAQIESARLLVWKACWLLDNNGDFTVPASIAKIAGTNLAQEVVSKAADIIGGRAYIEGNPLEKLYRDAKIFATLEGTNHIQNAIIASLL